MWRGARFGWKDLGTCNETQGVILGGEIQLRKKYGCDQGTELCIFVYAYINICTSDRISIKKEILILTPASFWVPKFMKNNVF